MQWTPLEQKKPQLIRGAEWYVFRGGRIVEIRAYYLNPRLLYIRTSFELEDFPYAKRGYPTLSDSRS